VGNEKQKGAVAFRHNRIKKEGYCEKNHITPLIIDTIRGNQGRKPAVFLIFLLFFILSTY
ncbi:MAG: hypothetical protein IIX96_02410, partial [Clostridia bacterium]|nr:hypothetical protein [Clostridia bacterium]